MGDKGKRKSKFEKQLRIIGVNCDLNSTALITCKSGLIPGIFFLQETKLRRPGTIKTPLSQKYII